MTSGSAASSASATAAALLDPRRDESDEHGLGIVHDGDTLAGAFSAATERW